MATFIQYLAKDSSLRDAYAAYLDEQIVTENCLDRIDSTHTVEHQKGRVALLRNMRDQVKKIDKPKREGDPT